jgi:hypothetical protein
MLLLFNAFIYAKSYALVIGVNGGNLIGAKNDANAMKNLLRNKGIKNITLLTSSTKERATKRNIIKKFTTITRKAKKGDRVYLFFSGHGTNTNDPSIKKSLQEKLKNTGALQPYGIKQINYKNLVVIKRDLVQLFKELERKKVKTVIMFDACYTGTSFKGFHNPTTKGSLSLYSKPTRNYSNYPYKYITYLSASTAFAVASESASKKRGKFSMALTRCLDKNHKLSSLRSCIKNNYNYTPTILPKAKDASLFFKNTKKDIIVHPKPRGLKEQLINLTNNQEDFQLYTKNQENLLTRNYTPTKPLNLCLNSESAGYFVLFMLGESGKVEMAYPDNTRLPKIKANSNKKILRLKAKAPFGVDDFVAFLVDEDLAKALQQVYISSSGILKNDSKIREVMSIIQSKEIRGSHFSVLSHEK